MRIKHGDATHVTAAYRLENSKGPYNQGFVDDQEHGAGWRILEVLKEKETGEDCSVHSEAC